MSIALDEWKLGRQIVVRTLSTGCNSLDKLLQGGIEQGEITLLYGEASTGKTTTCIQITTSAATKGLKVFFIDCDNSFTQQRFDQIAGKYSHSLSEQVMLFFPDTFERQRMLVESLGNYLTPKLGLVVIDSMSTLYRAAFSKAESIFDLNRDLTRQLAYLADLARSKEIACLITSQVHARLKPGAQIEPVARRAIFHFPSTILRIRNTPNPNAREFELERLRGSDTTNGRCLVALTQKGFTDTLS
jgi:DNA repair protein RadB